MALPRVPKQKPTQLDQREMSTTLVTLDFETYYDTEYSLSKMQTDAYILDPRFEVIGVGIKVGIGPTSWAAGTSDPRLHDREWWKDKQVLCHNTLFDGFILAQKFGIRPAQWSDTLGMAKALRPWLTSHSLDSVAKELVQGRKGGYVLTAKGKRLADFTPKELAEYGDYCCNDVALTYEIYQTLEPQFPLVETVILDATIRMFTEPQFRLDVGKITEYRQRIVDEKEALLVAGSVGKDSIMSNALFAARLAAHGVQAPMKTSRATGKRTFAFAKTDKEFTDLLNHPSVNVQNLMAARLGVKTTIAETRAQMMLDTGLRGVGLPVYLNYWGAKTTGRMSGGNKINMQNIPSRGADRVLREAMIAPPGYKVVVGDSSNIELRTNMVMSGQTDIVDKIRLYDAQGDNAVSDVYCDFASIVFGRTVGKEDKTARTVGKVSELSLGYGAGWEAFQNMLRIQGKVEFDQAQCMEIIGLYRETHDKVVALWRHCGRQILHNIKRGDVLQSVDVNGWFLTNHSGFSHPGDVGVVYKDLAKNAEGDWEYTQGRNRVKIYDGKVVENLSQHAARHIVMWQLCRVHRKYPVALTVHDEIVCVVPDEQAQACADYMLECLRLAPAWCRGLIPLNGEVGIGQSYGEAK